MSRLTLVDRLGRSSARHSAREAVIAGPERLSFAALWAAVERAAATLMDHGVRHGDRVALVAPATADAVVAYYAIWAAGAAVVPLDPDATSHELRSRLSHCDPRLVIAGQAGRGLIASGAIPDGVPLLPASELRRGAVSARGRRPALDDLAAILYTSGTTDQPKGVMLTHGNFAANTDAVAASLDLRPDDRVLSPLPLFYAYGSSVLHSHLAVGAAVLLSDLVYAEQAVERMATERVTGFTGVPWMFTALIDRTSFATRPLPALRYVAQAGARMPPADIARVMRARPGVAFFVMYGQTEATSRLTCLPPAELARRAGSVGRPIAGVRIEVRRPDGSAAAPDEYGEVFAAGPGVMAGYWRAPDATRAALIVDDRDRWLRTGDRGYLDAEGYLYLDGRLSDLIKVGGHRVSPAEVEDIACRLPGVACAAAVAAPDALLGHVVHLVVVRAPNVDLTAAELIAHCRTYLSAYKTPRRVTFTSALPHTRSGKLQRAHLARAVAAGP